MSDLSRRAAIRMLAAGTGAIGLGLAGGYLLRSANLSDQGSTGGTPGQASAGGMMSEMISGATTGDMSAYMDLFNRHTELHRRVELIPGGVRTITEADSPDLVTRLQGHVA